MNVSKTMSDDPGKKAFDHWDLVDRLAERRFRDRNIALEAAHYVLEKLGENNWERVRNYRQKGPVRAYLSSIIRRLLEDFARRRFGRRTRVPSWIKSFGMLWEKIYRLLCLEGHSRAEVIEIMRDSAPGGRSENVIREAITIIRGKMKDCGRPTEPGELTILDETPVKDYLADEAASGALERAEFINSFYHSLLENRRQDHAANDGEEAAAFKVLQQSLRLSPEERLILKMVYEDGMKVTDAGRILGLSTHVVHGRLRRLMTRIRTACECAGLEDLLLKYV